jgi:hypothetical protein
MRILPTDQTLAIWDKVKDTLIAPALTIFLEKGIAPVPGQDNQVTIVKVVIAFMEGAFRAGVSLGFDLGGEIYEATSELNKNAPDLAEHFRALIQRVESAELDAQAEAARVEVEKIFKRKP